MLSIDFSNIFAVGEPHGLKKIDFTNAKNNLSAHLKSFHARGQGFYTEIDNTNVVREINAFAKSVQGKYTHIVVLGIGGSSLGAICIDQAFGHLYGFEKKGRPRLIVLDNIDPTMIQEVSDVLPVKKTLFVVITKSGGTPETLSQYFYFRKKLEYAGQNPKKHFVFVTDPEKGLLRKIAEEEGITAFDVPPSVGGRFSVLTAVGLLPAALTGVNIEKMMKGAREMCDKFVSKKFEDNLPYQLATVQYLLAEKGKTIHVLMPYAQKLFRLADWYRQLLAESIGKAVNADGETVNVGITPVNALGATDQHSQSQLYNEGPHDKAIFFLAVKKLAKTIAIPNPFPKDETVSYLKKTSFNELLDLERQGTAMAYTEHGRPNATITIDVIDEYHLGQLFMLFEGATAFLGEWFGIDAYNQPGVELSKQRTKELLLKRK